MLASFEFVVRVLQFFLPASSNGAHRNLPNQTPRGAGALPLSVLIHRPHCTNRKARAASQVIFRPSINPVQFLNCTKLRHLKF